MPKKSLLRTLDRVGTNLKNVDGVVGPLTTPSVVEETVGTLQTSGGKLVEEDSPHVNIPTTPFTFIVTCTIVVHSLLCECLFLNKRQYKIPT